ncbi:MAG: hypothetical protein K2Y32_00305 [Candidatus Obscuribacterales bacterium]|nr:hypothetical protein [Candidatus Obscuribacterales bacterium]
MKGLVTVPFREAHSDLFEPHPDWCSSWKGNLNMLEILGKMAQACVILHDGRILFIGAYCEVAPGVCEVSLFPSTWIDKYPKSYVKEVKYWINSLKAKYRRLQCWGEDTDRSYLWLQRLGFTLEGKLRYYTVEGDMLIWGMEGDGRSD